MSMIDVYNPQMVRFMCVYGHQMMGGQIEMPMPDVINCEICLDACEYGHQRLGGQVFCKQEVFDGHV